ncbi:MAG: LytTR family transcriptional regulator [Bacteroidales bacterium]|nr:LytTR family transcriptional regulator [Bacteroidales bacterium]
MPNSQRITLNTLSAIHLVRKHDILYCKCCNSSTTFFLTNHTPIVVSHSIANIEKLLGNESFFRSHQSYLVNINHIKEINKTGNYSIVLSDNSLIPIATRKRKEIFQMLLDK